MGLAQLSIVPVSQRDVEVAWHTYRALILAEVDDPALAASETHQQAIKVAKDRFTRVYDEWSAR